MLATLDVPYVDTSAAELVWTLSHPVVPALAMTVIPLTGAHRTLELRVLGASHQVVLRGPEHSVIETLACLPGEEPHLPPRTRRRLGAREYRFQAAVEHVGAADLRARARSLRRAAALPDRPHDMVLAAFPSHPDALTALSLGPSAGGVSWRTWHVYPNSGQIVTTSTEVV